MKSEPYIYTNCKSGKVTKIEAEHILAADRKYLEITGDDPRKCPHITATKPSWGISEVD